ncbi:Threonine/homoserine/homoserine lactone efflux protein [Lishizhenia tianjinensis]|uniref:Threonine/homoserine/homoserine lactone efflux protein n=1 Tax=Lishizhenia tianjinensis TaxID=477690 RepID=A0A1I7B382_9FLAO|nr:LysE family transporter [Lishizhenia tianjinensis]SFT81676.1 Threonine/homoserine/homoserine lactone efflux protein [Lishizhenia tianjinensis]
MSGLIIKGIVTGLILSIMLGPAFFLLIETSIRKGVKAALSFDAGVLVSDIIYIVIVYALYQEVSGFADGENNAVIKLIGGIVFLGFGVVLFLKKVKSQKSDNSGKMVHDSKDYIMLFTKGLVLNMANPLVIFYWFSVLAFGGEGNNKVSLEPLDVFIYVAVILLTFFTIDVLKILGAKQLRPFITNAVLKSLNRITGTILFAFGIFLVVQSCYLIMFK